MRTEEDQQGADGAGPCLRGAHERRDCHSVKHFTPEPNARL